MALENTSDPSAVTSTRKCFVVGMSYLLAISRPTTCQIVFIKLNAVCNSFSVLKIFRVAVLNLWSWESVDRYQGVRELRWREKIITLFSLTYKAV